MRPLSSSASAVIRTRIHRTFSAPTCFAQQHAIAIQQLQRQRMACSLLWACGLQRASRAQSIGTRPWRSRRLVLRERTHAVGTPWRPGLSGFAMYARSACAKSIGDGPRHTRSTSSIVFPDNRPESLVQRIEKTAPVDSSRRSRFSSALSQWLNQPGAAARAKAACRQEKCNRPSPRPWLHPARHCPGIRVRSAGEISEADRYCSHNATRQRWRVASSPSMRQSPVAHISPRCAERRHSSVRRSRKLRGATRSGRIIVKLPSRHHIACSRHAEPPSRTWASASKLEHCFSTTLGRSESLRGSAA